MGDGMKRTRSHRDKNKRHPEDLSGPTKPADETPAKPKPATGFYLVVCGAIGPSQYWIFSDSMGYCHLLKSKKISGDFL